MAYVAVSNKFVDDVKDNINKMMSIEVKTLGDMPKPSLTGEESWLLDALWGDHLHLKDIIPVEWKRERDALNLRFLIKGYNLDDAGAAATEHVQVKLDTYVPITLGQYDSVTINGDVANIPELAKTYQWGFDTNQVRTKWSKVGRQVMDFVTSCKSVNEAIKLWPDVKHYIPQEYLDRVETKVVKSANESRAMEALASVDTNMAIAAVVTSRLASANI